MGSNKNRTKEQHSSQWDTMQTQTTGYWIKLQKSEQMEQKGWQEGRVNVLLIKLYLHTMALVNKRDS